MPLVFPESYRVGYDGVFHLSAAPTAPPRPTDPKEHDKKKLRKRLHALHDELDDLQRRFYALDNRSLLLVFQAMDAAGKDGTIRAVMRGVNPAGCQVHAFKQPTSLELDHDFLWRTTCRLPQRGHIGIFNRSYYEEVLVVRVHPEYLDKQRLPAEPQGDELWQHRFESIRRHEQHLARNGTIILKFWLNVSHDEQRRRFLSRLDEREKNWKFSPSDVAERRHWNAYMAAYQEALAATSRPWAPWYAIPADNKPFMRVAVAETVTATLRSLDLRFPAVDPDDAAQFAACRRELEGEA